jgi:uncharacterized protein (TIGR03437 family)
MKCLGFPLILIALLQVLPAQEVGQGAPSGVDQRFLNAFFRNRFNALVSVPPIGPVRRFGSTGYVQEFRDADRNAGNIFALIKADANLAIAEGGIDTYQVYPAIYNYLTTVGVADTGYPTMDTALCSQTTTGAAGTVCTYQIFTLNHALFSFSSSSVKADATANYLVKEAMFVRWSAAGGITALGPPTANQADFTAPSGTTATHQQFVGGALYTINSGAFIGRTFPVTGKVFALYTTFGLHTGSLGLPLSEELTLSGGRLRQNFEGGAIEYTATTDAVIRPSVGGVTLDVSTAGVTRLNLGDTLTIRAQVVATVGGPLTDREVSWVTTNGRVAAIQPNGAAVTIRAAGGGTAQIVAVSEGKSSPPLNIFVVAPCCQVGEGAPTTAIQQAFQDAVTRGRLTLQTPLANPVRRIGTGYVQELLTADNVRLLLCRSDRSPGVFLVGGEILRAYETAGGPSGRLGYPASDETAAGRQMFEGGALAGQPVVVVSGALLSRWESLGFENGALGAPSAAARSALSFTGATANTQTFAGGLLVQVLTGRHGSATPRLVSAGFLPPYFTSGGPEGNLGFPVGEPYRDSDGFSVQDFEGGRIRIGDDGTPAVEERERAPEVTASPSRVTAGSRVRIIAGGFAPQSTLRISFPGQPAASAFEIPTAQGAYTWEVPIAADARSGFTNVLVQEVGSSRQANTTYTVTALNEEPVTIVKLTGDTQTGLPGARLLSPLTIAVRDPQGVALVGIPVRFAASPGATILSSDAATNDRGEASAVVRLLERDGIALVTAEAASRVVTFSARAAASTLTNFPRQSRARAALLAASSSILRYHQNRGELPASLGLSEPALLDSFLNGFCTLDTAGGRFCDGYLTAAAGTEPFVNLWRLRDFAANSVDVVPIAAQLPEIVDALAAGAPVLIALHSPVLPGTHFVVAIGVASDGTVVIHDPEPSTNRQHLDDFLVGNGALVDAIRLIPRSPSPTPFLLVSPGGTIAVRSENGECAKPFAWTDRTGKPATLYHCSGLDRSYVVDVAGDGPVQATLTDLGAPGRRSEISGSGAQSVAILRPSGQWVPGPIEAAAAAQGLTNAATGTADLAPGTLAVLSGSGLSAADRPPTVELAEQAAVIQAASEFRLSFEIPPATPPGEHLLRVSTPYGNLEIPVLIQEAAPAIFVDRRTSLPAIVTATGNQPNRASNPVARGGVLSIYATGLGAVRGQGTTNVVQNPVKVVLQGRELDPSFAGLAPGLPGVYLVNVTIPQTLAPGLDVPLFLVQSGVAGNAVPVSIR